MATLCVRRKPSVKVLDILRLVQRLRCSPPQMFLPTLVSCVVFVIQAGGEESPEMAFMVEDEHEHDAFYYVHQLYDAQHHIFKWFNQHFSHLLHVATPRPSAPSSKKKKQMYQPGSKQKSSPKKKQSTKKETRSSRKGHVLSTPSIPTPTRKRGRPRKSSTGDNETSANLDVVATPRQHRSKSPAVTTTLSHSSLRSASPSSLLDASIISTPSSTSSTQSSSNKRARTSRTSLSPSSRSERRSSPVAVVIDEIQKKVEKDNTFHNDHTSVDVDDDDQSIKFEPHDQHNGGRASAESKSVSPFPSMLIVPAQSSALVPSPVTAATTSAGASGALVLVSSSTLVPVGRVAMTLDDMFNYDPDLKRSRSLFIGPLLFDASTPLFVLHRLMTHSSLQHEYDTLLPLNQMHMFGVRMELMAWFINNPTPTPWATIPSTLGELLSLPGVSWLSQFFPVNQWSPQQTLNVLRTFVTNPNVVAMYDNIVPPNQIGARILLKALFL
jgi:hypothetical protein